MQPANAHASYNALLRRRQALRVSCTPSLELFPAAAVSRALLVSSQRVRARAPAAAAHLASVGHTVYPRVTSSSFLLSERSQHSSDHRPLSQRTLQVRHNPLSRTAPAPSLCISASAARPSQPLPQPALSFTPAHTCTAPRRAGPWRRGCAPRSSATGRLAAGAEPCCAEPGRPCTFQHRKQN